MATEKNTTPLALEEKRPMPVPPSPEDNHLAFFRKMAEMRKYISTTPLVVDGYNQFQKYEYTSAKQYKALLNSACMELGMEYYLSMDNAVMVPLADSSSNQNLTRIHATVVLIDLDTGFSVGFPMFADGCDSLDKGIYKAETMLIKSFVQTTFLRHDKDEMDPEAGQEKKAPVAFTPNTQRSELAKQAVQAKEKATEQLMDAIFNAVLKVREVNPDFMQEGELDAFNEEKLSQVEAQALLYNIEEYAETNGIEL